MRDRKQQPQGRTPQSPHDAAKNIDPGKTITEDNLIMRTKNYRTKKNRLQHDQRSSSLSHRQKDKETPIRRTNQDNKNNSKKTDETLRTKEPQEQMQQKKTGD